MSSVISPDENLVLSGHGSIEQPIAGSGELYLTDQRFMLVHKSGLISKRETPLLDVTIGEISYVIVEVILRKVLVVSLRAVGGKVQAYKIHVGQHEAWAAQISNLKSGKRAVPQPQTVAMPTQAQTPTAPSPSRFCSQCGLPLNADAKFCPGCGKAVVSV